MLILQAYPLLAVFVAGGLANQFTAEQQAYFKAHNIKTRVTDLTPLDRYLHELNYPHINLTEISVQQGAQYNYSVKSGIATSSLIDIPQLMLLLKSTGKDEISLPNYRYETGWYFCYLGYCSGYHDIYRITDAKLHNLVPATANGGVINGTIFWLNYNGGQAEVRCPQCTYDHTDLRQNPPADSDRYLKRNLTMIAKNITVLTTFEMKMNTAGLEMEKLNITLTVGEYGLRYQNVTHTAPGGSQEELGEEVNNYSFFLSQWEEYYEEIVDFLQATVNCFLSDGRSGDNDICEPYYNPFVHMSMGQIFHGLGLVAISNEQPDNSSMSTCVADIFPNGQASDEIDLYQQNHVQICNSSINDGKMDWGIFRDFATTA